MLKIQLYITGINDNLIYIKIETNVLNCNNNSQYCCIFDQMNAAVLSIRA